MEKLLFFFDFSFFDFFFSSEDFLTEKPNNKIILKVDYHQLDFFYEQFADNTMPFWKLTPYKLALCTPSKYQFHIPSEALKFNNFLRLHPNLYFQSQCNVWHLKLMLNVLHDHFLAWLCLPLLFTLGILLFYIYDLYLNIYWGYRFQIEKKTKTFFHWNYEIMWRYYRILFLYVPRTSFSFFLKFPNPTLVFLYFHGFYKKIGIPFTYFLVFLYFYIVWFMVLRLVIKYYLIVLIFAYILWIYHIKEALWNALKNLGLFIKLFFVKYNKKTSGERILSFYTLFFLPWYTIFPFFFSTIQLTLISIYVVFLYLQTFYEKLFLWDGYFLTSLTEFYFHTDPMAVTFHWGVEFKIIHFDYFIALDGINIWMLWLTCLLVVLCTLFLWENQKNDMFFSQIGWIFLLMFASLQFFSVVSYFWMYIFFELSLLPIFVLVVYWGSNWWKIHAAYQMVLFTFIGSIFLLGSIFLIYFRLNTFNLLDIVDSINNWDSYLLFSNFEKKIIWLFMFVGFAVKTPLYPFHIWLPEAHSEAPTAGSVLLAGVLLKMGTYGFMRFVMPIFPDLVDFYKTLLFSMCICGILLSSLAALAQTDIKKIIAYSSIGHMGLVILGLCTFNQPGLTGGCFMMLSHGLISSALFFSIGLLYKIYGTRSVLYYSAIAHFMPKFSMCFYVFILANMGFPGTAGFPAEVLIFSGVVGENFFITLLMGIGSIIGGTYSIWLLTRVLYGQINSNITIYRDLKPMERKVVGTLAILVIFFGIFSYLILDFFKPYCTFFEIRCTFPKFIF